MIRVERTQDYETVRAIITHPRVYPSVADDYFPPAEQFRPPEHPDILYLLAFDGTEPLGAFLGFPENGVELRIHHFMMPNAWGPRAAAAARAALDYVWTHTRTQKVIGKTPTFNRLAVRFARRMGMQEIGVDRASIQKDGRLWDQVITGMGRPKGNGNGN